jgi:hypothetical protein
VDRRTNGQTDRQTVDVLINRYYTSKKAILISVYLLQLVMLKQGGKAHVLFLTNTIHYCACIAICE